MVFNKQKYIEHMLETGQVPTESGYLDMLRDYNNFEVAEPTPPDKTPIMKYINDNHVFAKLLGGIIGIGTTALGGPAGGLVGTAATLALQQVGLGPHRRAPRKLDNWDTIPNNYPPV